MKQEIVELRKLMKEEGMDVYYIPSGDFHSSEYVNDYFKAREFMSNLSGEAGDMLVTEDGAWLWTDGRYFLQAETQLAGTGVELMRMAEPGVPTIEEFLTELVRKAKEADADKEYVIGLTAESYLQHLVLRLKRCSAEMSGMSVSVQIRIS